jgi:molybdate transport system substrate-binding protein
MKRIIFLTAILLGIILLSGCAVNSPKEQAKNTEIFVSAAVSMKDALTEIQGVYEGNDPNIKLRYNFGGSGALQKQIEQGAPADIFLSAGKSQMDALESKGLIIPESRSNLVGNQLVLIVPLNSSKVNRPEDLIRGDIIKVAMGSPESVPAGKYAKETLNFLQLWNPIQPKLVYTEDVSQVLRYAETGNVDAGIVYQSDAKSSNKVRVVTVFSNDSHSPIEYPIALLKNGSNKKEAEDFLKYLKSSEAKKVFEKYGFGSSD